MGLVTKSRMARYQETSRTDILSRPEEKANSKGGSPRGKKVGPPLDKVGPEGYT